MGWFDGWFPWRRAPAVVHPTRAQLADSRRGIGTLPARHVVRTQVKADSLFNPLTGMGSEGDKSEAARPNRYVWPLDDEELRSLYNFNGIARRIVDVFPEYGCREGWNVEGADKSDEKRLHIISRVQEAQNIAQLYGNSAMLLVTIDDIPAGDFRRRPGDWLTQPLDLERVGELRALHVFDTFEAHPLDEVRDPSSPMYRQPEYWALQSHGFTATIHASRIVVFRGRSRIPSERWAKTALGGFGIHNRQQDASYLQAVWNQIRYLEETMKGGAILAQELQRAVYKIHGLDAINSGEQAGPLLAKIKAAQQLGGLLGATAIGDNDEFSHVAGTPSGFKELSEGAMQMLSMVTGIPQMIFFGEAPAGLSTDGASGWTGFRQRVSVFQEWNRPAIERIYQVLGAAQDSDSEIDPDDVSLTFNPLDEPSDREKAEARLTNARADAIEIKSGVLRASETRQRYTDDGGYRMELGELPEEIPPPPEPPPLPPGAVDPNQLPDTPAPGQPNPVPAPNKPARGSEET